MILPITAYGSAVLRKVAEAIDPGYPDLDQLIVDMWETLYNSSGVGIAAPQVNRSIRLFLVDTTQFFNQREEGDEEFSDAPGFKGVFINPRILSVSGKDWSYNEGCLSIPRIREDVVRKELVSLHYYDEQFAEQTRQFEGITARVILHEYDHIEGKLFIDYMKPLRRTMIKRKLDDISRGRVQVDYRMLFPL
jgi:peptide deformylase